MVGSDAPALRDEYVNRTILHLDLDAFFCAVEENANPALRGVPFAVGGRPESRGVVSSCSYGARRFGVHSAMPMSQAIKQCPGLLVVSPHFDAYRKASHEVMARLGEITPLIEQISIDEAFMDVTPHDGAAMARRLQAQINAELSLPCSFGVATNMLVAKIANNVGKASAHEGGDKSHAAQRDLRGAARRGSRFPRAAADWRSVGRGSQDRRPLAVDGRSHRRRSGAVEGERSRGAVRQDRRGSGVAGARARRPPGRAGTRCQVDQPRDDLRPRRG